MGCSPSAKEIVVAHMTGAVPERRNEIRGLWERYDPKFVLAQDAKHITLDATKDGSSSGGIGFGVLPGGGLAKMRGSLLPERVQPYSGRFLPLNTCRKKRSRQIITHGPPEGCHDLIGSTKGIDAVEAESFRILCDSLHPTQEWLMINLTLLTCPLI